MKFWLDLGIDGFRVDSAGFIYEDRKLRNEPRSFAAGATPRDYTYLDHIYTIDQPSTYELFGNWSKYIDEYSDAHNQDQKVNKPILFFFKFIFCTSLIYKII